MGQCCLKDLEFETDMYTPTLQSDGDYDKKVRENEQKKGGEGEGEKGTCLRFLACSWACAVKYVTVYNDLP